MKKLTLTLAAALMMFTSISAFAKDSSQSTLAHEGNCDPEARGCINPAKDKPCPYLAKKARNAKTNPDNNTPASTTATGAQDVK